MEIIMKKEAQRYADKKVSEASDDADLEVVRQVAMHEFHKRYSK